MDYSDVSGQAAFTAGDVQQVNPETIITGDLNLPGTADSQDQTPPNKTDGDSNESNKENAQKRYSDKEWQANVEKAQKFDKLVEAITEKADTKIGKNEDPVEITLSRINDLERKLERSEWERNNLPRDISEDVLKSWKDACDRKANPEDSWSRLSYEEIWKLAIPVASPSAITPEVKERVDKEIQLNNSSKILGSVSMTGGAPIKSGNLSDLDRKIAAEMGWGEAQYKEAGIEL